MVTRAADTQQHRTDRIGKKGELLVRFWREWVFPRLLEIMMSGDDEELKALRTRALSPTTGRVLKLGFGTGMNLSHYPPEIKRLVAVDPNPGMLALARERMASAVSGNRIIPRRGN